jgi:hypothetical protein
VFRTIFRSAKAVSVKFAARPKMCALLCEISKQEVKMSVQQDGARLNTGILEILDTEASIVET